MRETMIQKFSFDFVDYLPLPAGIYDACGNLVYFNINAEKFWNKKPAIGENWQSAWKAFSFYRHSGESLLPSDIMLSKAFQNENSVFQKKTLCKRADGSNIFVQESFKTIKIDGKYSYIIHQFFEINPIESTNSFALPGESDLYELFDDAPVIIWLTDSEGNCTFVNKRWVEFTGQSFEEALGFGWLTAVHHDDTDVSCKTFLKSNTDKTSFSLEYRLRNCEGVYKWAIDCGRPRFDNKGSFIGHIGAVFDISDRKQTEFERENLLKKLQEADRRKDEFLAILSHELRTPLNVICGHAELLRMQKPGSKDFYDSIAAIQRNATAQTQLIADLLDISRIVTGKFRLEIEPFEFKQAVEGAIEAIQFAADAKEVILLPYIDNNLGYVDGDQTKIQQLIWNLLSNAVKFSAKGGKVIISARKIDANIEIKVSDTGQGISRDFLPYIFDRFHQEDTSNTRKFGGLGLGLSIVKHIAELHGGSVKADSAGKGCGSSFVVSLPIRFNSMFEDFSQKEDVNKNLQFANQTEKALAGITILAIDDQPDALEMISKVFGCLGASVSCASSGKSALEILNSQKFDVIICDIGMPVMNGYELIRKWRAIETKNQLAQTPAIALTAYASDQDKADALNAGFWHHIVKPFKFSDLYRITADICGK